MSLAESTGFAHRPIPTIVAATLSITLGALPIFLVGALAVFIRPGLGFGELALGALATLYYLSSALSTVPGGRLAERLGGPKAMSVAAALSMLAAFGIAQFAVNWASLAGLLVLAGIANGLAFPSSNLALARGVPRRRHGVAFGIKQSAGPYAALLAGAAVPLIGLTVGWRWAFRLAGVAAVPILLGGGIRQPAGRVAAGTRDDVAVAPLRVLSLAAFFGVSASASLGAFYVESAVAIGTPAGTAGAMLSVGAALGVGARIGWGWVGDRHPSAHFAMITALLGVGSIAFAMVGVVRSTLALVVITIVVFATGWAWPSLLNFAVVRRSREAPGIASGTLGVGQFGGGIIGPLLFGLIVENASYRAAWFAAAVMVSVAAVLVFIGGQKLEEWCRSRAAPLSREVA